jgi:hypothetical protein
MRKTLTTVALLLALSCTAFGGEILIPPAPALSPASATQEPTDGVTLQGDMPNGVADSVTQTALELLAVLPSLL